MDFIRLLIIWLIIKKSKSQWYLISDYYMSERISLPFGGRCDEIIQDVCLYVNSHVNNFELTRYPADNQCTLTIDAGRMSGARHRMHAVYFDLELRDRYNQCKDFLEIYDGQEIDDQTLIGRFCGNEASNVTSQSTQQYITLRFHSDSAEQRHGFKFMFIRSTPPPCDETEYLCHHEDRCIDKRLVCDGTSQCFDAQDEQGCNGFYRLTGRILRLGSSGVALLTTAMVGLVVLAVIMTISVCVVCCLMKRKFVVAPMDTNLAQDDDVPQASVNTNEPGKKTNFQRIRGAFHTRMERMQGISSRLRTRLSNAKMSNACACLSNMNQRIIHIFGPVKAVFVSFGRQIQHQFSRLRSYCGRQI